MQQTSVVIFCLFGLLVAVAMAGEHDLYASTNYFDEHPKDYVFEYGVTDPHSGDVKEQRETRVHGQVTGSYSLVEPDGGLRTVHYSADPHQGFKAVVSRQGKTSFHGH